MKEMLGEEFPKFLKSYADERRAGLRANTLKIGPEELRERMAIPLESVPWCENGFYYPPRERPAQHPYYQCGLYYLQEPSAMAPASLLPVKPGERVLDLCAAPGGKSTELGARLRGEGVLVANDISNSRAKALLRNVELFGITNALVTNETPERLLQFFPEYFDRILVDAPCSGEGMFRKEPAVAAAWTPDKPETCAKLQREIVSCAVRMLRPGGLLLYSTCTFAPAENEGCVSWILEQFPDMELLEPDRPESVGCGVPLWGNGSPELTRAVRIWPHSSQGEGHFAALLQKAPGELPQGSWKRKKRSQSRPPMTKQERSLLENFFADIRTPIAADELRVRENRVYRSALPDEELRGIHFLRNGLFAGEIKKNRFEPSQQLALSLGRFGYASCLDLPPEDARIAAYLRGETIPVDAGETKSPAGWQLVCVDGWPLGWGKLVNGTLKNKYPAGWRKK